jgi:ABC-type transport system involved in cytochrome bd biosynthesis fused ATPase/permease subunit
MAVFPGGTLALRTEEPRSLLALYEWTSLDEPTEGSDCFQQRLVDHACSGKSMCVMGAAGCGKTVAQRAIKAAMEAQGLKVQSICLTHTRTRNCGAGAMTAHAFVMRHVLHGT